MIARFENVDPVFLPIHLRLVFETPDEYDQFLGLLDRATLSRAIPILEDIGEAVGSKCNVYSQRLDKLGV